MSSSHLHTGLEYVATALVFLPEPTTTLIGISLLGYVHGKKTGKRTQIIYRRRNYFSDVYTYAIKMKDGSHISYQVSGIRPGQMPRKLPTTNKLFSSEQSWESHRKSKNSTLHVLPQRKSFVGLQQGLLANRVGGVGYAHSVISRRNHRSK